MKSSSLYEFIKNSNIYSIPGFKEEINQYVNQRFNNKDTSYIYSDLKENGKIFDNGILIRLLELYLESIIGEWDLEYFFNWIEMSGYELTDCQEEVIFVFSAPEINYPITKNNIIEAIRILKEEKCHPNYIDIYDKYLYKSVIVSTSSPY